jgi:hypothetical protein
VPTQENYVWEFSVESGAEGKYKTLSWEKMNLKNSKGLILFDVEKNIKIDMTQETAYAFELGLGERKFKIYFGNADFLKETILPEVINVVVYPNPFTEEVKFNVGLTGASKVYLQIYNSLGQLVSSGEQAFTQAGVYEMKAGFGSAVSSVQTQTRAAAISAGVYLYQLQIESGGKVQKFSGKVVRE